MRQCKFINAFQITLTVFILATLSACAGPEQPDEEAPRTVGEEITATNAIDIANITGGKGLERAMDGSSLEAFERSLELVKITGSVGEYTSLLDAIQYLLIYDLGAKRDRAKLAARLDGVTGHDILAKVKWRGPE
jgi:hypothetical protein